MILKGLNSISLKIIHVARIPFHKSGRLLSSTSVINCISSTKSFPLENDVTFTFVLLICQFQFIENWIANQEKRGKNNGTNLRFSETEASFEVRMRWGWSEEMSGVINWLKSKTECIEHLKNHQITFQPFADNCIDADLFPGDNFLYISVLKSQQRLVVALSIIY